VVDLPGTYSLTAYSDEELVARRFVVEERPAAVVQVIDSTTLDRGLVLAVQFLELGVPLVLALNMMDEVKKLGRSIDTGRLAEILGLPVVETVAREGKGTDDLVREALALAAAKGTAPAARPVLRHGHRSQPGGDDRAHPGRALPFEISGPLGGPQVHRGRRGGEGPRPRRRPAVRRARNNGPKARRPLPGHARGQCRRPCLRRPLGLRRGPGAPGRGPGGRDSPAPRCLRAPGRRADPAAPRPAGHAGHPLRPVRDRLRPGRDPGRLAGGPLRLGLGRRGGGHARRAPALAHRLRPDRRRGRRARLHPLQS